MKRIPGTRTHESGFTLVELMIVIVIVGILASMAIPKFGAVVARAKLTELKQGLWHVIHLEKSYYHVNENYIAFAFGDDSAHLGFAQPDGHFTYSFDNGALKVTGMENGAGHDINFDEDGDDGLTITIDGVEGVLSGSTGGDFGW